MSTTEMRQVSGLLGRLVRSESRKLSSTRLWWGMLLAAAFFAAINAGISAGTAGLEGFGGAPSAGLDTDQGILNVYPAAAFAILIAVLILFVVEQLLAAGLAALDLDGIAQLLPSVASAAMTSLDTAGVDLLAWWQGGLVMLGYAVVFTGLGITLSLRRDVS